MREGVRKGEGGSEKGEEEEEGSIHTWRSHLHLLQSVS